MIGVLDFFKKKKPKGIKISDPSEPLVRISHPFLRPDSQLPRQEIVLAYHYAGMGDYIYWTTTMSWIIETHTHLHGKVMAPKFFYELAKHWLKPYADRFEVLPYNKIYDHPLWKGGEKFFVLPDMHQMLNSCGFHLLEIGFHYYANIDKVPDGWYRMPEINGDEKNISWAKLPEKYVVVTTEATSPIRKLPSKTINGITKYLIDRGFTPVFLGKSELAEDYSSTGDEGISTDGVVDLRDRTTPLEAAVILAKSRAVVGLDNGLLHLAACSMVPVIFGFNTVDPRHRGPPRREGAITVAVVPPEALECRFCQSNVRFVLGHTFHKCLYGDNKCLDLLTAQTFIKALEKVLT